MAQTPTNATSNAPLTTADRQDTAQTLNGLEPGNQAQGALAANLSGNATSAIASADAPAGVRGVDMGMIKDANGPNIDASKLEASAAIQTRQAQLEANPNLINASAKSGGVGYTAMKFGHTEALNKPSAGRTVTVNADAGEQFKVNFDPNAAQLSVRHGDLIFTFNDGSRIIVDHFVTAGNQMPSLMLPDGTILAGGVVVAQLTGQNADDLFNIETAAGPGGAVGGAGSFVYSDDLGDVIGLLDKLPPIPFTALAFPAPAADIVPFVFPVDFQPGVQQNYTNIVDETNGIPGAIQTGTIVPDFGRDGAGTITLEQPGSSFATGSTGGQLTSGGETVDVTLAGNVITGKLADGTIVFTMTVQPNGAYEFQQFAPLDHADAANPNDAIDLNFNYIVTDRDGDAATGSIVVTVLDDAPIANDDTHTTLLNNDTITGNVITGVGNVLDVNGQLTGADTLSKDDAAFDPGVQNAVLAINGIAFIDENENPAPGVTVTRDTEGNVTDITAVIQGQYGVLTMHVDGSYSYMHNTGTGLLQENFQYTLVDFDGDVSNATLTINIDDGVPQLPPTQGSLQGDNALDETFNIGQPITGTIDFTPSPNSPSTTITFGDTAGNAQFSADGSLNGGSLQSHGQPVTVALIGGVYVGYTGTDPSSNRVFTLQLTGNGTYSFTQLQAIDHANASDPNDVISLHFGVTATDADGDQANGQLQIDVRDDAPIANDDVRALLNNDTITGNVVTGDGYAVGADNLSQDDTNLVTSITFGGVTKSFGNPADVNADGSITINGQYGPLTIKADGSYSYTHVNGTGILQETFSYTLRDFDGDSDPANLTINIKDTVPQIPPVQGALQGDNALDESYNINQPISGQIIYTPSEGSPLTVIHLGSTDAFYSATGSVAGNGLHSNGEFVHVWLIGNTFIGYTGNNETLPGAKVFELVMDEATGSYTFTQYKNIDHADGSNPNDVITLNFPVRAIDADGDFAAGTLRIDIRDDAPDAIDDTNTAIRDVHEFNILGGAPDFVALHEREDVPHNQPTLYNMGVEKASNVIIDYPTTVTIDRIISNTAETAGGSGASLFAFTRDASGNVVNIQLLFGSAVSDPDFATGPMQAQYAMNTTGQLGFFILRGAGDSLTAAGITDADGTPRPGYSFSIVNDGTGNHIQFTGPDGVTHDLINVDANPGDGSFFVPAAAGHFLGNESDALVQGVAGRLDSDPANVLRYSFEDGPLNLPGNDLDYNDVQFKVTVNPTTVATNPVIDGNVLLNDLVGQDDLQPGLTNGTRVTQVAFEQNGFTQFTNATGSDANGKFISLSGEYGTLKIYENGNYSYVYDKAKTDGDLQDVFRYTIIDNDGDTDTAKLTITVGSNYAPIIDSSMAFLREDNLTNLNAADDVVTKEISINSRDGINSLSLTTNGLPPLTANGQNVSYAISTDGKTLTATAGGQTIFTVVMGSPVQQADQSYKASYTFTLVHPLDNPGVGENVTQVPVSFNVQDGNGDTTKGTLQLQIIDDVPHAANDSFSLGTGTSVNGNIIANDDFGADGRGSPALTSVTFNGQTQNVAAGGAATFTGANGENLTVNSNGDFAYTRPAGFGSVSPSFSYTIKDHDGDTSQATVAITGNDNPVIITTPDPMDPTGTGANAPGVILNEHSLLPLGQTTTSVTNVINFTAPDGVASLVIDTNGLPPLTANGQPVIYTVSNDGHTLIGTANGANVLTVTIQNPVAGPNGYQAAYTFTLAQSLTNPGTGTNVTDIPVKFTVSDTDGDTATATLPLKVIDDVPVASNDALVLGTASSGNGTNLLNNDLFNADGPANGVRSVDSVSYAGATKSFTAADGVEGGVKFVSFTDGSGTLKVFENGEYSFSRPASVGTVNQGFDYTIRDFDGDTSTAHVTISGSNNPVIIITPDPTDPTGVGANAPGVILDEHNLLPLGQTTTTVTNTLTFTAPDGFANLTLRTDGLPVLTSNGQPVTYQLSNDGHTLVGTTAAGTAFVVSVQNPTQNPDGSYQAVYQFTLVQSLTNPGDGKNVTGLPVQFTVTDSDGSNATSTLPLKVVDDVPVAANDSLDLGLNPSGAGTNLLSNDMFNADGPSGGAPGHIDSVTYAGQTKDFSTPTGTEGGIRFVSISTGAGTLHVFENGSYSFDRANPNAPLNQTFSYTIKDADGDVSQANVTITGSYNDRPVTILTPDVTGAGALIAEAALQVAGTDVVTNQVAFTAPDGVASLVLTTEGLPPLVAHGQPVSYSVSDDGHTLTASANGQTVFTVVLGGAEQQPDGSYRAGYNFTLLQPIDNPGNGQNVTDVPVKFIVTDVDGDVADAKLPLQIVDHVPSIGSAAREVDETSGVGQTDFNVVTGNIGVNFGADGPADVNAFTLTGLSVDGATNGGQLTSGGVPVVITLANNVYTGTANGQPVFEVRVNANGDYAFHQYGPLDHNDTNNPNEAINLHIGYNVTDHDGDTAAGSLTIVVHDDAPVTEADSNQLTVSTQVFNILGGAPDFPTLFERAQVPFNQPELYRMGVEKASNVRIDYPTIIQIDKIVDPTATVVGQTSLFAFTQTDDGRITNIQLVLSNGVSDPSYASGPSHAEYAMTDTGKLGFFIVSGGTYALEQVGAIDSQGNVNAGFSFGIRPYSGGGYVATYTTPDGVVHDLPYLEPAGGASYPQTAVRFGGEGFADPIADERGLSQGIAGRNSDDPENVLRYGFEDTPLRYEGNDLDYNDVQFKVTVNPTYVQVSPPISGNVLPNDRVGLDVISGHAYNTMVTQIALGLGAFVSLSSATQSDANGKYVDVQGEYGVLRMHEDGSYSYTLSGKTTGGDLVDDFRYTIRDADGDTSNASTLTIHIVDSGAVVGGAAIPALTGDYMPPTDDASIAPIALQPDFSPDQEASTFMLRAAPAALVASHDTVVATEDASQTATVHNTDGDTVVTADHPAVNTLPAVAGEIAHTDARHFALDGHFDGLLTSDGQPVELSLVNGAMHGMANGENVFTLALDESGHYQLDVQGQIDQANLGTTIAFGYKAEDGDGAAVEGQFMIGLQGDHAAPVNTHSVPADSLALHDLVSPPVDHAAAPAETVNVISNADIINSILVATLDNHDPHNGYGGQG